MQTEKQDNFDKRDQNDFEEEIPEAKLSQQRQQEIFNDFKIAIRNVNFEKVEEFLSKYQKDLDLANRIDPQSRQISTYLAVVIPDEDAALRMLTLLVKYGAVINFKDGMKQSVLFYCSRDGKCKVFEFLMRNGIDVNESDLYNQTPLFYASRENRIEYIKHMINWKVDVNHIDSLSSQTALFYAAREGHVELCKLLMDNGCKANHQDSTRKTALFFAKKNNKREVVDLITQYTKAKEEQVKQQKEQENAILPGQNVKKKKEREVPKQMYKLIYTDDSGNQREMTHEDFENFQREYPDIAKMILNADDMIDEYMIAQVKDEENWEKVAKKILAHLWKAKGAYFFHQPVDPKKYGIDDYFQIVKKPMDFGTIRNKLNQNIYRNCTEFTQDVNQVFENCLLYNGTEHEVGKVGMAINTEFKQLLDQYNFQKYSKEQ